MCLVEENSFIENLVKGFAHSPLQLNNLQESDSELIRISENSILALTTDNISEEIGIGLYDDPYTIGWMTVTASVSDLCAVGAKSIGVLLSQTFQNNNSIEFINELQVGVSEACKYYKTYVLGGDTNYSEKINMGATAIGLIQNKKPLMRKGCCVGDLLFVSGKVGGGNCFAFSKLSGINKTYRPFARVGRENCLLKYATSCMDSSDGFFATLDQLMRVNNLGFRIDSSIMDYLDEDAISLCVKQNMPYWFMLAGPHGEYELIFTVNSKNENDFLTLCEAENWSPIKLGEVIDETNIRLNYIEELRTIETSYIRNLFAKPNENLSYYLNELMKIENNWRKS